MSKGLRDILGVSLLEDDVLYLFLFTKFYFFISEA